MSPLAWLGSVLLAASAPAASQAPHAESVVALSVTYQEWNEDRPWSKRDPGTRRGSAVVVDGPYLLTTADMVVDATFLQADKFGRQSNAHPRIHRIDPEINLALLTVDAPEFFADLRPARAAAATPTEGVVRTVRWREQQLEAAASRIQRIEVQNSWYGGVQHPFLLVETDVRGGGWSEPVFLDGQLVGLTASQNEQRARVIPVEILASFLRRALAPGPYRPFPVLGFRWQENHDPALTAWLGQRGQPTGVLVRQIPWGTSGCGTLEPWDILLSLDGHPIDAEGFYAHRRMGQLLFTAIGVEERAPGDEVSLQVLRGGKTLDLEMRLRDYPAALELVPRHRNDDPPPYVIAGGLLLRELDVNYLRTWGKDWSSTAPLGLLARFNALQEAQTPERRRFVVLTGVFPSEYTLGYQDVQDAVVEIVNGRAVDGIDDVVEALRAPRDGYHVFVLAPDDASREIVLDAAALESETARILEDYRIPEAVRLAAAPPPPLGPACPGDF